MFIKTSMIARHTSLLMAIKEFFKTFWEAFILRWRVDRLIFVLMALGTIVDGVMPIALSYSFKLLLDRLTFDISQKIELVSIALIGILALRFLLQTFSNLKNVLFFSYLQRISRYRMENYLNYSISEKISNLDIDYFENSKTQNLISKVTRESVSRIPAYAENVLWLISSSITLILAILALAPISIWIPLVAIIVSIPRVYTTQIRSNLEWSVFNKQTPESRWLLYFSNLAQDELTVTEARIFRFRKEILEKIDYYQEKVFKGLHSALKKYISLAWIPILCESVFVFIVIYLKLPATLSGVLGIGSLVFLVQILDQVMTSTTGVNSYIITLVEDSRYIKNYFELLNLPPKIIEKKPGHVFEEISAPTIQFSGVNFQYPDGKPVLKNISFSVKPGEHLAIVGPNGAGKTTLIKLLLRLYDPTKGSILINDFDLKDVKLDNWYKFVSTLFQSFIKYSLTVSENIMMSASGSEDKNKIKKAAQMSGADEFIEKFPKKYNQQLGRKFDGEELSVGQWQKLALARAFYEEAPVLILDEPTSAIDAEAEAEIFDNLNKVYKDKTVIFISHRFSTVRNADKIIVLKDGRIAEEGTHESLMLKSGIYARMFKKQAKGYID